MSQEEEGFTVTFGTTDDGDDDDDNYDDDDDNWEAQADKEAKALSLAKLAIANAPPPSSTTTAAHAAGTTAITSAAVGSPRSPSNGAQAPAPARMTVLSARQPADDDDLDRPYDSPQPAGGGPGQKQQLPLDRTLAPVLLDAMGKPAQRATVLRFEEGLVDFVNTQAQVTRKYCCAWSGRGGRARGGEPLPSAELAE